MDRAVDKGAGLAPHPSVRVSAEESEVQNYLAEHLCEVVVCLAQFFLGEVITPR